MKEVLVMHGCCKCGDLIMVIRATMPSPYNKLEYNEDIKCDNCYYDITKMGYKVMVTNFKDAPSPNYMIFYQGDKIKFVSVPSIK